MIYQSNISLFDREKPGSINIKLVILFVFSILAQGVIKVGSIQNSAIVSMLMVSFFVLTFLKAGRFIYVKHPIRKPLLLLFWSGLSLIIVEIYPFKSIPKDIYNYSWATGLNSFHWRGISFFFRLLLSVFTIQFIISNVKTEKMINPLPE